MRYLQTALYREANEREVLLAQVRQTTREGRRMKLSNFWNPPPSVRAAINRGDRKLGEWRKRVVAEAEAERRAELERRKEAA